MQNWSNSSGWGRRTMASLSQDKLFDWVKKKYYFSDGSCVLLVCNEILKIHRSLLEENSGFFSTMFTLPQSDSQGETESERSSLPREGESDDNPIMCRDSLADFKALCWGLYASPMEVSKELKWETSTIPKLISLLAITHKYEFQGLRNWALDILDTHSAHNPTQFLPRCGPWKNVGRLLILTRQCGRCSISERIEDEWVKSMSSKPFSLDTFNAMLDVVEDLPELRKLHGKIYFEYLKGTGVFNAGGGGTTNSLTGDDMVSYANPSIPTLKISRLRRLQGGLWSLMQLRNRLFIAPSVSGLSCSNVNHDMTVMKSWWEVMIEDLGKSKPNVIHDPFYICKALQEKLRNSDRKNFIPNEGSSPTRKRVTICDSCMSGLTEKLQEIARNLDQSLPDHFDIPPCQPETNLQGRSVT